jgi:hypothetical protein
MTSKKYVLATATIGLLLNIVLLQFSMLQHAPRAFAANPTPTPTVDKGKRPVVGSSSTFTDLSSGQQDRVTILCADDAHSVAGAELTMPAGRGNASLHNLVFMPMGQGSSSRTYCSSSQYPTLACPRSPNPDMAVQCEIQIDPNGRRSDVTASFAGSTSQDLQTEDQLNEGQNSTNHVGQTVLTTYFKDSMESLIPNSGGTTIWNLQAYNDTEEVLRTISIQETPGSFNLIDEYRHLVTDEQAYTNKLINLIHSIENTQDITSMVVSVMTHRPNMRIADAFAYIMTHLYTLPDSFFVIYREIVNAHENVLALFKSILKQQEGSPIELTPRRTSPTPTPTP